MVTSHVMSGTIFFIWSASAISVLCAAIRISAWQAAPKRWRRGWSSKKEKEVWQNQNQQRWTWLPLSRQVPHPWTIRLRRKALGYARHLQGNLTRGQEEIKTRRSVQFSRKAKPAATDKFQDSWEFSDSESWRRCDGETCCVQKFREFREF